MKIKFDFDLDACIQGLTIEASSVENAKEKLNSLSSEELLELLLEDDEAIIKDHNIGDIEYIITEQLVDVEIYDIQYDIQDYDLEDQGLSDDEIFKAVQKAKESLPSYLKFCNVELEENDDIEEILADAISDETGFCVQNFSYKIINRK